MPVQRSKNKARLRQQALEAALTAGADYLLVSQICSHYYPVFLRSCEYSTYRILLSLGFFFNAKTVDVDCFLVNPQTLQLLMKQNK